MNVKVSRVMSCLRQVRVHAGESGRKADDLNTQQGVWNMGSPHAQLAVQSATRRMKGG